MRRSLLLALPLFAAPLAFAPAAHAASASMVVHYYPGETLTNGGTLDTGITDRPFEFFLILSSGGTADLEIGTVTAPAGFTITDDPSGHTVASGATDSLQLRCDAGGGTASGTLTIPTNDPSNDPFEVTLTCDSDGSGVPGLKLIGAGGASVPDGGEVDITTGDGQLFWVYNDGGGTDGLDLLQVEIGSGEATASEFYVADNVVAYHGIPVYFYVNCKNSDKDDILGDSLIKIPVNNWEDYHTFTVHCVAAEDEAGIPSTGSNSTLPLVFLAAGLVTVGFGVRFVARRRA